MSTPAQIAANQNNAQLSTGPASAEGKAKSSLNAVKTGLTGRTVLLPSDDAAVYQAHVADFFARHQPANPEESNLVQSLADTEWRLLRIPALEFAIYALGRLEFASVFDDYEPSLRPALLEARTYLVYHRQFSNLSIQENRLRRQREKDSAALRNLQQIRRQQEKARLTQAARQYIQAVHQDRHELWEPAENGFEFSIEQVEVRAIELEPDLFAAWAEENAAAENAA